MKTRRPTYLDKIGHGNMCAAPLADFVAFDVAERDELEEPEDTEHEEDETPDVLDLMSGRERWATTTTGPCRP